MKVQAYGNNMLVEVIENDNVFSTDPMTSTQGKVISVGGSVSEFKEGDEILFTPWGMNTVKVDDKELFFVICDPLFVLGKVDKDGHN